MENGVAGKAAAGGMARVFLVKMGINGTPFVKL
jgi:hypothetical protein